MLKIFPDVRVFREFYEKYFAEPCKIVATSGGFDPVHIGHLRCIQETVDLAKSVRGITVVIVNGDGFLTRKKGKPFMSHDERMEIIAGLEGVDYVVGWDDGSQTVTGCLEILKPAFFTKGGDRSDPENVPEYPTCQKIGCEIKFGVGGKDKVQSSSDLIAGANFATPKIEKLSDLDDYDLTYKSNSEFYAVRENRVTEKPWGYEELLVHTDKYAAKILTIMPGQRLSKQYHETKDETIYVVAGTLQLELGDGEDSNVVFLQVGECKRIPTGTVHRFGSWNGVVKLFEVSTPELDDVVRIQDDYGRG